MAFENENSYNEGARFLKLRRDFPLTKKSSITIIALLLLLKTIFY